MKTEDLIVQYLTDAGGQRQQFTRMAILTEMFTDVDVSTQAADYLWHVLDKRFNYYVTLKGLPEPKMVESPPWSCGYEFIHMIMLLDLLHERKLSGGPAMQCIADFRYCAPPALRLLFEWAIDRKLPGGIGSTIVNKVKPGLIRKQPYGGVKPWDADTVEKRFKFKKGVMLEKKEDGMTLMIDFKTKEVRTRQGQDVSSQMADILKPIYLTLGPIDFVAHVEAKMWDINFCKMLPRPAANGEYNALFQGDRVIAPNRIVLTCLDLIKRSDFYEGTQLYDCERRYDQLVMEVSDYNTAKTDCTTGWPEFEAVEMTYVYSLDEARSIVQRWIVDGFEGGILKDPMGKWKSGKMTSQMKMKNEFETTLMVYGIQPHKRHKDWVGSLLCCSSDGKLKTKVGSGLNEDPDSELYRCDLSNWPLGTLVEVKAEKISKNNALDLPRIIEKRHDKDTADSFDEVKDAYNDSVSLYA